MNEYFVSRRSCPGCGSNKVAALCAHPYVASPLRDYLEWYYAPVGPGVEFDYLEGSQYKLNECLECGLVYQEEVPGPVLLTRLYDTWLDPVAVRENARKKSVDLRLTHAAEIAKGLSMVGLLPSGVTFLDFGMGWGHWCFLAKGFGCNSHGLELSEERRQHGIQSGISVLHQDDLQIKKFDFINAHQVFEHLVDPLGTLKELAASLNPGGIIRISVPQGWDIKRRLKVWNWNLPDTHPDSLNPVAPLQHINCFSFRSMEIMGRLAGLQPEAPKTASRKVDNPKDAAKLIALKAFDTLLPQVSRARRERLLQRWRDKQSTVYFRAASAESTSPSS